MAEKKISFDLNLFFLGEFIYPLYHNLNIKKQQDNGEVYDYWNYIYQEGNYEKQLEGMKNIFQKRQEKNDKKFRKYF